MSQCTATTFRILFASSLLQDFNQPLLLKGIKVVIHHKMNDFLRSHLNLSPILCPSGIILDHEVVSRLRCVLDSGV